MKQFSFLIAIALALASFGVQARAQTLDPTPAQIQAIQTDLQNLILATSADQAQLAQEVADSTAVATAQAAVTSAQTTLANDQAAEVPLAAAVATAEKQLFADVTALTPSASGAKAGYPGPHPEPRPWINPIPWLNPTPYYPTPNPYIPNVNPTPAPAGYEWVLDPSGKWQLVPIPRAAAVPAPCDCKAVGLPQASDDQADMAEAVARGFGSRLAVGPYREATLAVRAWRAGATPNDPNDLTAKLGRTPRFTACQKATMAVIALEMVNSFSPGTIPPQVLALAIQLQQQVCNAPVPTPAKVATKHLTGAKPSPRAKLAAAPRYKATGPTPAQFAVIPATLSMWGNDSYGDCVPAEEAFAKAAYSTGYATGLPPAELFISESEVISWASAHGFLNGASLTDVMDAMAAGGMTSGTTTYNDGPYSAIDWTNSASLCNAITVGPVKIGVAAGQLQNTVGSSNGWIALNFRQDQNIDHCVSLSGYGSLAYCCSACGVTVPAGVDPKQLCYLLFTWDTVGIINQASLNAICGEAWLRNPTTVVGPPAPPTPTPTPGPTPTRRAAAVFKGLSDVFAEATRQYQTGGPAEKASVLALLEKLEADLPKAKQQLGMAP